jgi:hypothetical protein
LYRPTATPRVDRSFNNNLREIKPSSFSITYLPARSAAAEERIEQREQGRREKKESERERERESALETSRAIFEDDSGHSRWEEASR